MQEYHVKKVDKPHSIYAEVPGSKSITNRALLIAALAEGKSTLQGVLFSDDSRHFLAALQDLGFEVNISEETKKVTLEGMGGKIPVERGTVDVGSAGTAARFLTALLGLSRGTYQMNSSDQMKKRPMGELITALEELGTVFDFLEEDYHFPFQINGLFASRKEPSVKEITIDIDKSSQFLSALLIVSVLFKEDFVIHVTGEHGMAYVDMTVRMMEQFGFSPEVSADGRTFMIPANASYQARDYVIEPDLSAACYFYAAGAILGVPVQVKRVHLECLQGDVRFLRVLQDMGCGLMDEKDGVLLCPSREPLKGGEWNLSSFSDQALTLAAIAPFTEGGVRIQGISHIRYQECDRIAAIIHNVRELGVDCNEKNGDIQICSIDYASDESSRGTGSERKHRIHTYEDHRVAMSFALTGLLIDNVVIENPLCCRKTFENYFEEFERAIY